MKRTWGGIVAVWLALVVGPAMGCGGGGGAPPPANTPAATMGILYIQNNGTECFDCMEIYIDGVFYEDGCGVNPLCPGETADAVIPRGHFYDILMYQSSGGFLVDFPTFFFDQPTYTLVIVP